MHARNAAEGGPVLALAQECSRLRGEPVHCLVTTDTDTRLVPTLDGVVTHQLAPGETAGSIARFLGHWSPDICVEMGSTDRPRLFAAVAETGIPMFHVAASRQAAARQRLPSYLSSFQVCLAGSASEAEVFRKNLIGANVAVEITGPLSDTINALACNEAECDTLGQLLGGRPVWLAASALEAEMPLVELAHRRAFRAAHRLLLIVVPADLEAGQAVRMFFEQKGWRTGLRSEGDEPDPDVQVYVADTEDELGLWYRLAPASFVGGTLVPGGVPADPFDPAALGSAVLHGPLRGDTPTRFEKLQASGACLPIKTAEALGEAVTMLLAPDKAAALAQAGWAVTTESAHVVERLAELIDLALDGEDA